MMLENDVRKFGFSNKLTRLLINNEIFTVQDILRNEDFILNISQLGQKCASEIDCILEIGTDFQDKKREMLKLKKRKPF